jgi:hypothetical protein
VSRRRWGSQFIGSATPPMTKVANDPLIGRRARGTAPNGQLALEGAITAVYHRSGQVFAIIAGVLFRAEDCAVLEWK